MSSPGGGRGGGGLLNGGSLSLRGVWFGEVGCTPSFQEVKTRAKFIVVACQKITAWSSLKSNKKIAACALMHLSVLDNVWILVLVV